MLKPDATPEFMQALRKRCDRAMAARARGHTIETVRIRDEHYNVDDLKHRLAQYALICDDLRQPHRSIP